MQLNDQGRFDGRAHADSAAADTLKQLRSGDQTARQLFFSTNSSKNSGSNCGSVLKETPRYNVTSNFVHYEPEPAKSNMDVHSRIAPGMLVVLIGLWIIKQCTRHKSRLNKL